jgi:hypothetical protein
LLALQTHGACPEHRKTFSPVTQVLACAAGRTL